MYRCNMCKQVKEGEPAFKNGAGLFCEQCKTIIHERAKTALEKKVAERAGNCVWCGELITSANAQKGKEDEHVCLRCEKNRDWLLKAVRWSERPARYVARIEERERPLREEREKAKAMQEAAQPKLKLDNLELPGQEDRLRRVELLLSKLTEALGV